MSDYQHRENSGSVFKNENKATENHPEYKGSAMINGQEMWVSIWVKKPEGKKPFLSLSFQNKEGQSSGSDSNSEVGSDDLPF